MIGGLLAKLAGSAWARTALRYGVTALTILLFLLTLRRSGERAGRLKVAPPRPEQGHSFNRGRYADFPLAPSPCPQNRP